MDQIAYVLLGVALMLILSYAKARYFDFMAQSPMDYAQDDAQFDLRSHLNGPIECEGVIYGPTGRVTSRFTGMFEAQWTGNTGIMREEFRYDSGTVQHREWHLTLGNDGKIKAEAADVIGTGTGSQVGSAVQLKYRIRLPEEAGGHVLNTVDWMYLAPNGSIVNRSQFRKFGIKVAELVATMRRVDAA
ncbi:MAG: DUF3833 family protein [Pseudomonadota bacterium]